MLCRRFHAWATAGPPLWAQQNPESPNHPGADIIPNNEQGIRHPMIAAAKTQSLCKAMTPRVRVVPCDGSETLAPTSRALRTRVVSRDDCSTHNRPGVPDPEMRERSFL